jgi:hypothetical protein
MLRGLGSPQFDFLFGQARQKQKLAAISFVIDWRMLQSIMNQNWTANPSRLGQITSTRPAHGGIERPIGTRR